ncbi:hypothetical protein [Allocoleopsis sp.]|uniref:hypothetical protein n=1 Tax=Allocoleopsis sp. TaxID=3088169 RepID=UPI002FD287F5
MSDKPNSIEELEQWLINHADDGKIEGQPVIETGTIEIRSGFVPGDLYDEALLRGAALSFNKSEIGINALIRFLSVNITNMIEAGVLKMGEYEARTEFRAYIPTGLHNLVMRRKDQLGLSNSQIMTISLSLFVNDLAINELYQQYLDALSEKYGLSTNQIEQKIFDFRRYQARVKRLELSKAKGEFVSDRKIAT